MFVSTQTVAACCEALGLRKKLYLCSTQRPLCRYHVNWMHSWRGSRVFVSHANVPALPPCGGWEQSRFPVCSSLSLSAGSPFGMRWKGRRRWGAKSLGFTRGKDKVKCEYNEGLLKEVKRQLLSLYGSLFDISASGPFCTLYIIWDIVVYIHARDHDLQFKQYVWNQYQDSNACFPIVWILH